MSQPDDQSLEQPCESKVVPSCAGANMYDNQAIEIWHTREQVHGMDYCYVGWSAYDGIDEVDFSTSLSVLNERLKSRFPGRRIRYCG